MTERYINFEILFDPDPDESGSYGLTGYVSPLDQRVRGEFLSPFSSEELSEAFKWIESGHLGDEAAQLFGTRLFEALFNGKLRSTYDELAAKAHPVRYRLVLQSAEIAALPWELMFDPVRKQFLSTASPVVRNLTESTASRPLQIDGCLRILVVDAFPRGFEPLQSQTEAGSMRDALRRMRFREDAHVEVLEHATREKLRQELRRAANASPPQQYHVLHFIGHGELVPATGMATLLFEDDAGEADPVSPEDLLDDIRDHNFSIVFLNACQSLNATAFETTEGFAPALLGDGIPAVIGMQLAILDRAATRFTREFYQALADGDPVDGAVTAARRVVGGGKGIGQAHMGVPVVYLRTPTGHLFDVPRPPRLSLNQIGPWLRHQLRPRRLLSNLWALFAAVAVIIGLVVGGLEIKERYLDPPPEMTGDFNVAVAAFGEFDESGEVVGSSEGAAHADSLYRELEETVEALDIGGFDIVFRGPDEIGSLRGRTEADRAKEAARIAESIKADLIIYGTIDAGDTRTRFKPEFYLSPFRLGADGETLAGHYDLGSPIDVAGNVQESAYRSELRSRLLSRAEALTHFVVGLTRYTQMRFDLAVEHFEDATNDEGWDRRDGKELAYVFLGNARGKLHDLEGAADSYREALDLESEYARAHLGLAEVLFIGSQPDGCESKVDVDGMIDAAATLDRALDALVRPATGEIEARVSFGTARIYACLASSGVRELDSGAISEDDLVEAARREYETVIGAFDEPGGRVRDMVAEANAGLGLTYLLDLGDDPAESFRLAAAAYEKAESLSRDSERRAGFLRFLGFIAGRLDECADALTYYTAAIDLVEDEDQRRLFVVERSAIEDRIEAGSC